MKQKWYLKLWSWLYCFYAEIEYSIVIWRFNCKNPGVLSAAAKWWRKILQPTPAGRNAVRTIMQLYHTSSISQDVG